MHRPSPFLLSTTNRPLLHETKEMRNFRARGDRKSVRVLGTADVLSLTTTWAVPRPQSIASHQLITTNTQLIDQKDINQEILPGYTLIDNINNGNSRESGSCERTVMSDSYFRLYFLIVMLFCKCVQRRN